MIQEPKTPKSKRTVILPEEVMDIIKEYKGKLYSYEPSERFFNISKSFLLVKWSEVVNCPV